MNTCATCIHWKPDPEIVFSPGFLIGTCEREPFDITTMRPDDMAVVCGHDGPILTGPQFGCLHHTPRPAGA
jgi:hypothetical protein